jgi:hypothetical protein
MPNRPDLLVILNPVAGRGRGTSVWPAVRAVFDRGGSMKIDGGYLRRVARAALPLVVLLGGFLLLLTVGMLAIGYMIP